MDGARREKGRGGVHVPLVNWDGAVKALGQRRSLLTVGVREVEGRFEAGEVVQLKDGEGNIIGVAKVRLAAAEVTKSLAVRNVMAAHADDIVLF